VYKEKDVNAGIERAWVGKSTGLSFEQGALVCLSCSQKDGALFTVPCDRKSATKQSDMSLNRRIQNRKEKKKKNEK
jgi:hypothetical protein